MRGELDFFSAAHGRTDESRKCFTRYSVQVQTVTTRGGGKALGALDDSCGTKVWSVSPCNGGKGLSVGGQKKKKKTTTLEPSATDFGGRPPAVRRARDTTRRKSRPRRRTGGGAARGRQGRGGKFSAAASTRERVNGPRPRRRSAAHKPVCRGRAHGGGTFRSRRMDPPAVRTTTRPRGGGRCDGPRRSNSTGVPAPPGGGVVPRRRGGYENVECRRRRTATPPGHHTHTVTRHRPSRRRSRARTLHARRSVYILRTVFASARVCVCVYRIRVSVYRIRVSVCVSARVCARVYVCSPAAVP